MSRDAPFTADAYCRLVGDMLARGYELRDFHECSPDLRHLVMRHDIDQSIPVARALADLESEAGWRSTWFVLVRTEMYNPFSREATRHLRAMIAAGHEIGLHLDATYYDGDAERDAGCLVECRMLEDMLGAPVRMVSFHRPARELIGSDRPIGGRPHTYMPRYARDMGYCSDSRGLWRHGHPSQHAAVRDGRALQLLTHAVWWIGPDDRDALGRLRDVLNERHRALDVELASNNDVWR
jgi:hypothetical protein